LNEGNELCNTNKNKFVTKIVEAVAENVAE